MSYIIDGHNLIGAMPDIQLADPEDELRLLERLRAYRAHSGGRAMIVFFDSGDPSTSSGQGSPARSSDFSSPGVQVRFAGSGRTADDAIVAFLQSRAQPGQYAVVTDDRELSRRVRAIGASVLRASDFAGRLGRRAARAEQTVDLAGPPVEPLPDPHAPAFADLYTGFIEAEKSRARFEDGSPTGARAWIEKLYGDDIGEAQRAARWLGQYGRKGALGPLHDALTHGDARVRAAALLALGDLGDPAALPALCDHLEHDTASMARQAAAQSLARVGDPSVESALEAARKSDPKSKVRKAAQAALTQIRARRK